MDRGKNYTETQFKLIVEIGSVFRKDEDERSNRALNGTSLLQPRRTLRYRQPTAYTASNPKSCTFPLLRRERSWTRQRRHHSSEQQSNHEQSKLITFDSIATLTGLALFTSKSILFRQNESRSWAAISVRWRFETFKRACFLGAWNSISQKEQGAKTWRFTRRGKVLKFLVFS